MFRCNPSHWTGTIYEEDAPVNLYLSSYAIENLTHLGPGKVTLDKLSGRAPTVRMGGFGTLQIDAVKADGLM